MIGLTTIKNEQLRPIRTAVGYFLLPVQTGVNRVGSAVYSNFKNQEKMRTALADNESLREQVATLTMENTRLQSDSYELSRLRKLYELNQTYGQYRMTGARVIAKDTGNWFHVFRIDKGARIKRKLGCIVLAIMFRIPVSVCLIVEEDQFTVLLKPGIDYTLYNHSFLALNGRVRLSRGNGHDKR